ncbi:MAG: YkgJ family cysteine cluster protein [Fimbriimonadaceae bacterium]
MATTREGETAGFDYRRSEPFSYTCNRCKRCCYGKRIPLNPYDLIRLGEVLHLSTGELIEKHTDDGIFLKVRTDIAGEPCVFLGEEGCTVHSGRPGACRVYPLGRSSTLDRDELFALVEPHPQTEGVYSTDGTIGSFLEGQGAEPYFDASQRYLTLFGRLAEAGVFVDADLDAVDASEVHALDVDATVARYCLEHALPPPENALQKMVLHIQAIESTLDQATPTSG